jgi:hypothetical protein
MRKKDKGQSTPPKLLKSKMVRKPNFYHYMDSALEIVLCSKAPKILLCQPYPNTLPIAKILSVKIAQAWVSMVSYLKKK